MPIKCAGAPQKAMYLSCHRWERAGVLGSAEVQFHNAAPALFGVAAYVPALEAYIARYGIDLQLESRLVSIDGAAKVALLEQRRGDTVRRVEERFDMIHVVRSEEHTSELQSLMRISYAVFCLKTNNHTAT